MIGKIKSMFLAAKEEVATRGGLFGQMRAFASVVGQHPAVDSIRSVMGDIKSYVQLAGKGNLIANAQNLVSRCGSALAKCSVSPNFG